MAVKALFACSALLSSASGLKVSMDADEGSLASLSETDARLSPSLMEAELLDAEALMQEAAWAADEQAEEEADLLANASTEEPALQEPPADAPEAAPEPAAEAAPAAREEAAANTSEASAENATEEGNASRANLSTYFDPKLMAIFREKQAHLKETMKDFMVSKKELDVAKLAANLAMKKLRLAKLAANLAMKKLSPGFRLQGSTETALTAIQMLRPQCLRILAMVDGIALNLVTGVASRRCLAAASPRHPPRGRPREVQESDLPKLKEHAKKICKEYGKTNKHNKIKEAPARESGIRQQLGSKQRAGQVEAAYQQIKQKITQECNSAGAKAGFAPQAMQAQPSELANATEAVADAPAEAQRAEASANASEAVAENATEDSNATRANLSTYFDPKLMAIFREKQAHLKETMKDFMVSKKELDVAKLAANLAMKKLRLATEKRRKILMGERMAEAEERRAIKENRRQAKTDMTARAEQLLEDSLGGLAGVNMSYLVDVVLALPEALQDEEFVEDFRNVTKRVDVNVRKFLDQTQQKTTQFVKDSTSASDVELRFIMAKFFHESGFRLRGLHQDSLKAIQMLRRTVPEDLERALFPFLGQLNANTVRLRINATSLATATPKEACDQITQIMANVSDYPLETIGKVIENVSTRVLPNMERTLQVSPNITTFVGSFLNMARLEVGGLQEAAHSMVTRASPIIAERVQCTFSGASSRFGLVGTAAALVATWLLL
ncbi:unnamed protein product [Prorocentrum cordatum]|uniref:Uncharacterized protein n=1 Tax=Prorocentrum cordatum TaxID=2364126 RepID=A0ABN9VFP2_9DINO|nr:unnamed protein product [Polarella glacialis]